MQPLPRIEITQNLGRLAVRSERAVFQVAQDKTELDMQVTQPAIEMEGDFPRVEIDQTGSFASAGLKKPIPLYMDFVSKCKQEGLAVIGKIAGEGREFLEIQKTDRVIQDQSRRIWQTDLRLTVAAMPSVRPEIRAVLGDVQCEVKPGDTGTNWNRVEGQGKYAQAKTNVSWLEKPEIHISVAGGIDALV